MSVTKELVKGMFVHEAMNEQLVIVAKKAKNNNIDYQDFNVSSNGDFSTPKSLTDEVVSYLKIKNGDNILDVSVGADANFVCSILECNKNVNIWIADISLINLMLARKKIKDLFDYDIPDNQVILYNTIEEFKEGVNNMNFNKDLVVVGNPPYDDTENPAKNAKLWSSFTKKVLELQPEVIALVTPNAAFKDVDSNGMSCRKLMKDKGYGLVDFRNHGDTVFDVSVETCHWIISLYSDEPIDSGVFSSLSQIDEDICNRVVGYHKQLKVLMENDKVKRDQTNSDSGKYEILFSGKKVSYTDVPVTTGGLKVVLPFSCSYHSMFITDKPTGMLNMVHYVNNRDEAEKIIKNSTHPLLRFVASKWKRTSGFTPLVKNGMVPDLTDVNFDDIYDVFGISEEQKSYIKKTLNIK